MTVVPAYGRRYETAAAVREAWGLGHDFRISQAGHRFDGAYVNKDDPCEEAVTVCCGDLTVHIRSDR
jgi:hypothetical protein